MSIKELMSFYDYRHSGSCSCDGYLTEKYNKGEYQFRWRKNKYLFKVMKNRIDLIKWTSVQEAENYLKTLHAQMVQA